MTDDEFVALGPGDALAFITTITDTAEVGRLRVLYAGRRGMMVDGAGQRAITGTPSTGAYMRKPFQDPRGLGLWARGLIGLCLVLQLVSFASNGMERVVLRQLQSGGFATQEAAASAAQASDERQRLVALIQLAAFVIAGVVVLTWLYSANANARRLGATGVTSSPGWSVGAYFIPVASWFLPFVAMRDLWRAGAAPGLPESRAGWLVPAWWACWLTYIFASVVAQNLARFSGEGAGAMGTLMAANTLQMVADLGFIGAGALLIVLVTQIQARQMAQHEAQAAEAFA